MRFHLVDRIDAFEPGRWIRARKLTSAAERYWVVERGSPTMPPQLVLESLCQAGGWLITLTTDGRKRAALASVGEARFHAPVRPGQILRLDAHIEMLSDEMAVLSGEVRVQDEVVLTATDVMCVLIDSATLDDEAEVARTMQRLTVQDR